MFIHPRHASNHLLFSWPAGDLQPYLGHLATIIDTCKISHFRKSPFIFQIGNSVVGIAFSIMLTIIIFVSEYDTIHYIEIYVTRTFVI